MKRYIVKESQLREYVERKCEDKIFYEILEKIHYGQKYLNENISKKNHTLSIIDSYKLKNLITPRINEMLIKHKII